MSAGGFVAGGAAQGFGQGLNDSQQIQNMQAVSTLGMAAKQLAGVGGQQGQQAASPLSGVQGSGAGQQGQQGPTPQPAPQSPAPQPAPQLPSPQPVQTGVARSPTPQAQLPGLGAAQPGVANSASPLQQPQTPPQPQAPPPGQGTAQLAQNNQPSPQQPPQRFPPLGPEGRGQWTPALVTQAMAKARPGISDRDAGLGLMAFAKAGLLSPQGLTQYQAMEGLLRQRGLDIGKQNADTASHREKRLTESGDEKPGRAALAEQIKSMRATALAKYRAIMNAPIVTPEQKKQADKDLDEANAKADAMEKQSASGGEGKGEDNSNPIVYDRNGKAVKWNGKGDSKDDKNYEPVE